MIRRYSLRSPAACHTQRLRGEGSEARHDPKRHLRHTGQAGAWLEVGDRGVPRAQRPAGWGSTPPICSAAACRNGKPGAWPRRCWRAATGDAGPSNAAPGAPGRRESAQRASRRFEPALEENLVSRPWAGEKLGPVRPVERFSRVGAEFPGTPRSRPPASDAPGARQGQPRPPSRPLVLQPGQGLGPVQTLDVLDEGEDAAANPLVS